MKTTHTYRKKQVSQLRPVISVYRQELKLGTSKKLGEKKTFDTLEYISKNSQTFVNNF